MSEETAKPETISKEDKIAYAHQRLSKLRRHYAYTILGQIVAVPIILVPVAALVVCGFFAPPIIPALVIPCFFMLIYGVGLMGCMYSDQSIIKKELEEHKEVYKEQLKEKPNKIISQDKLGIIHKEDLSELKFAWIRYITKDWQSLTIMVRPFDMKEKVISDFESIYIRCGRCSYEFEKNNEGKIKSIKIIETKDRIYAISGQIYPIGPLIAPFEYIIRLFVQPKINNVFEFDIEGRLINVQIDKNSDRKAEDYQWQIAKNLGISDPDKKLVKDYVKELLVNLKVPEESINTILGFSPDLLENLVDEVIDRRYVRDITVSEDGNSVKFFGEKSKSNQKFYLLERRTSKEGKNEENLELVEKVRLPVSSTMAQPSFAVKENDRRAASSADKTNFKA